MNRQAFWTVTALALALAAPAAAKDDKNRKEEHQDKVRREARDDERFGSRDQYRGSRGDGSARFRGLDRNGDGVITRGEWRGHDTSFDRHDLNRDGVLAGHEVRAGARRDGRDDRFGSRATSFGRLDRNGDGVLEGSEWPYGSSDFRRLDRNGNGVVDTWEYRIR